MKKAIAILLSIMIVMAISIPAAAISTIPVKSIKLDNTEINLQVGQTTNLAVTFTPGNTTQKKLAYITGNKNVASVNTAGVIKGVHAGNTIITVLTLNKDILAKCKVTISLGKQVTLQYWYQGTDKATEDEISGYVKKFNVNFPNIKIELTGMSTTISDQETKLNAAKLSGTYPDIIHIVLAEVASRGALNDFEKLQPYVDKWEDKNDIITSAFDIGNFKGELIALGCAPNPQIYTYRKDLFKQAGLDPEKPPKTWAELTYAAIKLTKREGGKVVMAGIDLPAVDSSLVFTEPFMRSAGSLVIDEVNNKPSFTDPGAIVALTYIRDLAKLDVYIPHDFQKANEKPFMNKKGAIGNINAQNISKFKSDNPELANQLGYMPVLSKDGTKPGIAFCGYQLYAMGSASKYKSEAWEFIKFLMSKEIIWSRSQTKLFPPIRKSLELQYISADPVLNPILLSYVKNGKGKATVPWINIYNKYMATAYEEVINGKKSPEQALNDAMSILQKEIK